MSTEKYDRDYEYIKGLICKSSIDTIKSTINEAEKELIELLNQPEYYSGIITRIKTILTETDRLAEKVKKT